MNSVEYEKFIEKYLARFKLYYKRCVNQKERSELKRSVFDNNNLTSTQKKDFWGKVIIMKDKTIEDFIKDNSKPANLCYYYSEYSGEIQESLKKIYAACYRFGLYKSQILYMLDEALKPFAPKKKTKKIEEIFDL